MTGRRVSLGELASALMGRAAERSAATRYLLGIAGPPAAGKSTLSVRLRDEVNRRAGHRLADVAPMDGFHLSDAELTSLGALARKGEPDTFDAAGYASLLAAVRVDGETAVPWPTFDRSREVTVPGGVVFTPEVRIVVTEGNYLLLDAGDWVRVRPSLDEAWFVDADPSVLHDRLLARHRLGEKSPDAARTKTVESDLPNARLVRRTKHHAHLLLRAVDGQYRVE